MRVSSAARVEMLPAARPCGADLLTSMLAALLFMPLGLLSTGCLNPYLIRQMAGQVQVLARARPVGDALADPALPAETRARLGETRRVLEFAREQGFTVGGSYQTFVDLGERPPVWVLFATPPDALEPHLWRFPLVGWFPYKGFFDRQAALREKARLEEQGLEALIRPAGAYSTLGWLPDPVFSSILLGDAGERAEVLLHELTHRTLFVRGRTRFNEGLATFLGEAAAERYLAATYGEDSAEVGGWRARLRDRRLLAGVVEEALASLREGFRNPSRAARLLCRELVLAKLPLDLEATPFETTAARAYRSMLWSLPLLLSHDLYGGERGLFERAFVGCGSRIPDLIAEVRALTSGGGGSGRATPAVGGIP
ncbi:MAG: aminopeptidase [Planctomycetota bacterium]